MIYIMKGNQIMQTPPEPPLEPPENYEEEGTCPACGDTTYNDVCPTCGWSQQQEDYYARMDHLYDLYKERSL